MARQRFIWPDFWKDPDLGRCQPVVQLFFIGCFSNADDEGRLLADVSYLRSIIFPYLDFPLAEVERIRDEALANCSNLVLYEAEGKQYIAFRKWSDYQKPKYPKPSKLPSPPDSGNVPETLEEASGKDEEGFTPRDGLGREGLGLLDPVRNGSMEPRRTGFKQPSLRDV